MQYLSDMLPLNRHCERCDPHGMRYVSFGVQLLPGTLRKVPRQPQAIGPVWQRQPHQEAQPRHRPVPRTFLARQRQISLQASLIFDCSSYKQLRVHPEASSGLRLFW